MKIKKEMLPKGWQWVKVPDVLDPTIRRPIRMGPFGSQLKKEELVEDGIFVLGIEHVLNKRFDDTGCKFITKEKFEELKGFEVLPGDVLMTTMGTIGRTAVVPSGIRKSIISSHLLKLTIKKGIYPEYIAWVLGNNSPVFKKLSEASQGAIMQGLNTDIVKNLVFPIPIDFDDQVTVTNELERKMTEIEKMRQTSEKQLEAIQALRSAILRETFDFQEIRT